MEWGGICGSDLAYWRHGASGTAVLQPARWSSATRWPAGSPRLGAGVTGLRGRAAGHRPPGRAGRRRVPARPARRPHQPLPADPLLRVGGVRPAHRRRVQRAAGGPRRPDPAAARRRRAPSTARWPSRSPSPCTPCSRAGDVRGPGRRWSTGPARSARWWSPRPSTAARPPSSPPTSPTPRWRSPRPWAPTRSATWPPGDTLPEDAELVFEASGAPAALGGVLRATARGGTARPGRQPARHRRCPPCSATWSPGRSPGSGRTGSSRRSATRSRAMRDGLDVSPADHPPVRPRPGRGGAGRGRRTGPAGSSKVMLRLRR